MRFRITIRGEGIELRGFLDGEMHDLSELSARMEPFGIVIASIASDDYDPFKEERERELHHFETEQENERLQRFAEYVMELHRASADGTCARCGHDFPCSEHLMAKEALGG